MAQSSPPAELSRRVARLIGSDVESGRPAPRGYTPARRWSLTLANGQRVFAKCGADTQKSAVATWLRHERRAYEDIAASFMPRLVGWDDDGHEPLLLLEDLSHGHWPPPWDSQRIAAVRALIEQIAALRPPAWAEDLERRERRHLSGWLRVRNDPDPFLSLGIADEHWLDACLPALIGSAESARLTGDSLVHFDLRSDNLCLIRDGPRELAILVDWNWCGRGSARFDLMSWLPSLHAEGGPAPWEVVDDSEGFAALLSGYFAAQAGLPPAGAGVGGRQLQLACLEAALPWATRELGLPSARAQ